GGSGVKATLTSILGLLDVGIDPFGILSGNIHISAGKFLFRVGSLDVDVPGTVHATASGIVVSYDPNQEDGVTIKTPGDAGHSEVQQLVVLQARGAFTLSYNG